MSFCESCGKQAIADETVCSNCGTHLRLIEAAGANQAAITATSASLEWRIAGQDVSRILAAIWILSSVLLISFSDSPGVWALLLVPSWFGAFLPLIRSASLTAWADRWEEKLLAGHVRASDKDSKFSRYFSKPLYGGSLFVWRKTQPIADAHLRAGLRVSAVVYFTVFMVSLLIFVGYIVIGVVIAVAIIMFALWALSGGLSRRLSGGSHDYSDDESEPMRPVQLSRLTTDFFGQPKTEHFDDRGNKVGESRPTTDFFGNPKTENFDEGGNRTGESRPTTDFFGNPKTENFDESENRTGESRPTTEFFGDPKVDHFDEDGSKTGESHPDKDFFGNPIVRHDKKE